MVRAVVVLAVLAASATARAGSLRADVWSEVCDASDLEREIVQLVDPTDRLARVIVVVGSDDSHYVARLTFEDRDHGLRGPREVTATSCDELMKAVVVVAAMALPDFAELPAELPDVAELPPAPPRSEPERVLVPGAAHAQTELALFAAGAGSVDGQGVRAQAIVGVRGRRGARSLGAEVRVDAPVEQRVTDMARIEVRRFELSAVACLHRGRLSGCAVATAGILHGEAFGLDQSRDVWSPQLAGGAQLTWEQPLSSWLALRAHADIRVHVRTTQIDVDYMPVWNSERFEASAGIGMLAHFP